MAWTTSKTERGVDNINDLKNIFDKIQSTNSRKEKEALLLDNKDNKLFTKALQFLLNPYITTGISSKKIVKKVNLDNSVRMNNLLELLNYIQNNNTGRDEDIAVCQQYMCALNDELKSFVGGLITKSLKLGIDAKTANKIYGKGFIPTFECMLAEKYFEHPNKVEGKEFTVTLKLDGIRCLLVKDNGKVSLFSRQGQPIEGLVDIEDEIVNFSFDNFVLDGELLISSPEGIPSKEQYKATTKIVRKDGEKQGIIFRAFDMLHLEEFKSQKCNDPYSRRRDSLNTIVNGLTFVKPLRVLYSGTDTNMIMKILEEVRADNQEGVMININDAPYVFKRTTNLLKVKVMQDCDLMITGFEEGSGRLSGTLGRLNVDYKGNTLGVGGGFSDTDRAYFWTHQQELLGRVIKVQYFEETQDKDGVKSLRFPVFKELREIGKEVSYS